VRRIAELESALDAARDRLAEAELLLREQGRADERAKRWEAEAERLRNEMAAAAAEAEDLKSRIRKR